MVLGNVQIHAEYLTYVLVSLIQSGRERRIDLLRSSRIHPDHPHLTWYPEITWVTKSSAQPRTENCYDLKTYEKVLAVCLEFKAC